MKSFIRRRNFVLDKGLQYRLLAISIGYVVFFISVLGLALFAPLIFTLSDSSLASPASLEAARSLLYLHQNFWPAVLLTFIVITLHSIRTSHRIAGPLFRFRRVFESVSQGVIPSPAPLRRGDYLHAEMQTINEMLESLRSKLKDIQEAQKGLSSSIAAYSALADAVPGTLRPTVVDLMEKGDQLAKKIQEFKI